MSGDSSPTSAWPARSLPTSASVGPWTLTTQSAWLQASSPETSVAPASSYIASGNDAADPAPRSTKTSIPAAFNLAKDVRDQGDAVLAGQRLSRNADLHLGSLGSAKSSGKDSACSGAPRFRVGFVWRGAEGGAEDGRARTVEPDGPRRQRRSPTMTR